MVRGREAWRAAVHEVTVRHDLAAEQQYIHTYTHTVQVHLTQTQSQTQSHLEEVHLLVLAENALPLDLYIAPSFSALLSLLKFHFLGASFSDCSF